MKIVKRDISKLLTELGSPNPETCHAAEASLLKICNQTIPDLVGILKSGAASSRKAAAFLLGKLSRTDESLDTLKNALEDPEPKVRKNAIITLAAIGNVEMAPALISAFEREQITVSEAIADTSVAAPSKLLRYFNPKSKHYRRIGARYEKNDLYFLCFIQLAAILDWLKNKFLKHALKNSFECCVGINV